MKAIRIEQTGGPDMMALVDVDAPALGANDIRIRSAAIGVNYIDTYHRSGLYPVSLPSGLGGEAAGLVEAIGVNVTRFKVGDRAGTCSAPLSAYAEAIAVHEDKAVKLPDAVSFDVAASSMLKGMTARYLLRKTFPVQRGQFVVVHAAAGGVGQIAVQWAKHLGAVVIGVVGSEAKANIARDLGAHHAVDSSRENIAERVRAISNGEGAHVVYDGVGKDTWDASLDSLRRFGMMVSYGNASGPVAAIAPIALMQKGSLYLTRPTLAHHTATAADLDECAKDLWAVLTRGVVKIAPPTRYKLADAAQAHCDLEARKTTGSLVLIP